MSTYYEKLKDPRWQKRRLEIMQRDEFRCQQCQDEKSTLAVHHLYYIKGRTPWSYPDWALETLCENCHTRRHAPGRRNEWIPETINEDWEVVIAFFGADAPAAFCQMREAATEAIKLINALGGNNIGRSDFWRWLRQSAIAKRQEIENAAASVGSSQ